MPRKAQSTPEQEEKKEAVNAPADEKQEQEKGTEAPTEGAVSPEVTPEQEEKKEDKPKKVYHFTSENPYLTVSAVGVYFSDGKASTDNLAVDGDYVGECYKAQAKVEFTKEEIKQCGTFFTDNKVVGCKGTGSLTMHKVNSRMAIKVANMVRNKQDVRFTLISKLADPDAYGAERVSITGVQMDDLTLFDWEAQKPLETEAPFTFTGYEYLDQITPQ